MILNGFLKALRNVVYGDAFSEPTHIAIGTGTTAVVATDTALETEVFPDGANRSAISSRTKPSNTTLRQQVLIDVGEANGYDISEIGVSDAATGGTFQSRTVFPAFSKTAATQIKIQVKTTYYNVV